MLRQGDHAPPLRARDLEGQACEWPIPGARGALILAFTRPIASPHGRRALLELAAARARLAALGAALVAVVPSTPGEIRAFADGRLAGLRLVADADGALGRAFSMGRDPWGLYTLRGLQQGHQRLGEALVALRHGGRPSALRESVLPAELLLDAEGRVRWLNLACARSARPALGAMEACLRAGGSSSTG